MDSWPGRETADIVYTDRDGRLTQYLGEQCVGGMPERILDNRNYALKPIEYYLEVKTTTSTCDTRFFMSDSQYRRVRINEKSFLTTNPVKYPNLGCLRVQWKLELQSTQE